MVDRGEHGFGRWLFNIFARANDGIGVLDREFGSFEEGFLIWGYWSFAPVVVDAYGVCRRW